MKHRCSIKCKNIFVISKEICFNVSYFKREDQPWSVCFIVFLFLCVDSIQSLCGLASKLG